MPEEVNRRAVDRLAGLLLCSTRTAVENLAAEGVDGRAVLVGDVMADVAMRIGPVAERRSGVLKRFGVEPGGYLVATLHRAQNVDGPEALTAAVEVLRAVADRYGPLIFAVHPRTAARLADADRRSSLEEHRQIILTDPLGYLDLSALVRNARAVLTDSGGLQKEAYLAGVPCVTLRERSEWVETVELGWNHLVGLDSRRAIDSLSALEARRRHEEPDRGIYGDGEAGRRCAAELLGWVEATAGPPRVSP
jgi:UDP-N-acetylglucosamine 2-epimerase (non-hydrolysing)/UDP-GlcNAc3NAcA epimerase